MYHCKIIKYAAMSRFVICRASAGSGKTYTLVRQFIEIAISVSSLKQIQQRFGQILAITFTNKAANGMKERLMSRLHDIVVGKPSADGLVGDIALHLQIGRDEVVRRCQILQSAILHNYSNLSVCTIDSFVHRLVRTFAHDLHLPMNFNVQIDQQEILQSVVDELLSLAGSPDEEALTRVLCAFSESRMESGKGYKLENNLLELSKEILKEESPKFLAELEKINLDDYVGIHDKLLADTRRYEKEVSSAAKAFVDACSANGLDANSFPYKGSSVYAFMRSVAEGSYDKLNKPHKRVDDACESGRLYSKNTPQSQILAFEAVMEPFRKACQTMDDGLSRYNTNRLLISNLYGLALLDKVNRIKNEYYIENEIVHISEFNKRIDQEVANEPAPFIYERIGNRYHNYLIDEFQDTSRLQWLNFLPLLDEAMTYDFPGNTAEPGTQSLVVGDGKQAIYRFRQGDVRQFVNLPNVDSSTHGLSLRREGRVDCLKKNFRTLANIVRFNNRFFTDLVQGPFAANTELRKLYIGNDEGGEPELVQDTVKPGGYVNLSFLPKEELLPSILAAIRHQVDDLHYSYGDITVLARDNDTLVRVSDFLSANSPDKPIPIVSSESFVLTNSRTVLLMQSLLEYIHDPRNYVAAVQALELAVRCGSIGTGTSSADVSALLWRLRESNFDLARLLQDCGIRFNIDYLHSLSLYDCCEELLRTFLLQGKDSAYAASFLNAVASYMQHARPDLQGLVKYLDERLPKLSSSTASDLDAVQLMTIHKAKGLENRIVILAMPYKRQPNTKMWVHLPQDTDSPLPVAFVNMQSVPTAFDSDFDNERMMSEMDRVNVLYVALTRPEEKLIVCCEETKSADSFAPLLQAFAQRDGECVDLGNNRYAIGEDAENPRWNAPNVDASATSATMPVDDICFPRWEDRVAIAAQNDALLSSLDADSRRYGIVVHDLMSRIITADDIQPVVERYCRENHISPIDADSITQRISRMVNDPANRRYFDPRYRVKCEASIAVGGKTRRPDRIVFDDNQTWVVDFKTGARNDETHRDYQRQVAEYADALASMGFPNVQPVIIYL